MVETTPGVQLPDLGEVINGRYRIDSKLGKGGMGQVYCAHDLQTQRDVALKYLSVPKDKPAAVDRFKSEFAKLAQFPHPNISAVYDFGHDDAHDMYFFTSELIQGQTFFEGTRGLEPLEIEDLTVQTLRALEYLHNHHLVHYDIKPGNVLITEAKGKRVAKVIDFGVADYGFKGRLVGTPSYMAPEMTRREIPDQRSDLYSLGVMWYQTLAGIPDSPFRGQNRDETFYNQQMRMLPPLTQIHPEIPAATDAIISRLLAKKPEDRFPYAAAVIVELNLSKARAADRYDIETRETRQSYIPSVARFVGREDALAQMRNFLKGSETFWITGAKGVGKSRLLAELRHIAQLNGFDVAGATADDPLSWDAMRIAISRALEHPTDPTLLWVDDSEALRGHRDARALLDDITTLENYLSTTSELSDKSHHITLALTATTLPKDAATHNILHIALTAFTEAELAEYVRAVTGFETPPEGFVEQLRRYTEGNPYFVTELMRALIDQNIMFDSAGRWKATTFEDLGVDFSTVRVPGSLADALGIEYNRLSAPEQELLSLLAVWKAPALPTQLEQILGHHIDPATPLKLLKKSWIDMDISTSGMTIPNPNRRVAVEALIAPAQKEKWHLAIAMLLEKEGNAEPEYIHWHFAQSKHPKRAPESLWALAEHYVATHRPLAAIETLQQLAHNEPHNLNAKLLLGKTYRGIRRFDDAVVLLEELEREFKDEARICEEMAITLIKQGKFDAAEFACMRGLQILQQNPASPTLRVRIENYLGQIFLARGAIDRAIDTFTRTRDDAQKLPIQDRLEIANNELCNALFQKADYEGVIREAEHELKFYEEAGKTRQYLLINYLQANAYRNLKQNQKAKSCFLKGIEIARTRHDPEYLYYHYHGLANLYTDMSQNEEALQQYERALDMAARLGDPIQIISTKTNMAVLHSKLEKMDAAERDFLGIIDFMHRHPPANDLAQVFACRAHLELGDMYVKQSRFEEAPQHLDAAEQYVRKHANCSPLLFSIQITRAELHRDMGDKHGARKLIETLRKTAHSPEEIHQLDITETTIED